jgi:phosphoglucosamine mutase
MAKLFGTDGVRGVAGRWPLTPDFVRRLGWAAGRELSARAAGRRRALLIVRDTRASGPALQRALSAGLSAAGVRPLDGGVLPTAAVAAVAPRLNVLGGAVLSASHNPAEFNGVKFFDPHGLKWADHLENAVEALALSPTPMPRAAHRSTPFPEARRRYLDFLRGAVPAGLSLRGVPLVIDCANGAASGVAPGLFRSLGAKVVVLSAAPNGRNINRGCGALHPEALARAVRRTGAALGVAFDGDSDRAIFVDEGGHVRDGDAVLLLAARRWAFLNRLKANRVVVTVMTNLGLFRALEALGIQTETTAVGDKNVWEGMKKTGAVLGGEPSGHVIFRDFLPTGDGLLTALQVLTVLAETGRPLSALASLGVRYPQVLLNVPVKERRPLDRVPGFAAALAAVQRALGSTGRTLIRYSGTEPLLRVMVEGPDHAAIERHAQALARAAVR